jgi:hypothetical protein
LAQDLDPSFEDALAVREDRHDRVREFLSTIQADDLTRRIDVLESGPHPLLDCLRTVFEEEFWHNRYARRDLELLTAA